MKKVYLLAFSLLACSAVFAQSNMPSMSHKIKPTRANSKMYPARVDALPSENLRDIIFEEDFQDPTTAPGDIPAGWSTPTVDQTEGTATAADDTQGPSFRIHNSESVNEGGYFPVSEVGVGNQFAAANDDGVPCDCDNEATYLQTPAVDFTGALAPAIQFDIFHDGNYGGGDAFLSLSADGGDTWTQIDYSLGENGNLSIEENTWQHIVITLFDYAGLSDIRFRFNWSDNGEWASGFAVDNVEVGNLEPNSLTMDKVVNGDWNQPYYGFGLWDYTMVPILQVDSVRTTSVMTNTGLNTLTNLSVNLEVFKNGSSVGVWPSLEVAPELLSLTKDTISVVAGYVPDAVGEYTYNATAVSDSTELDLTDNVASGSFMVTECEYARDFGSSQGSFEFYSGDYAGNLYDLYQNQDFSSIHVALGVGTRIGQTVVGRIYEFQGFDDISGDPILSYVDQSQTLDVTVYEDDLNSAGGGNFICLPFEETLSLEGGKIYMAAIEGTDTLRFPVSGTNIYPAVGSWLYRDSDASFGWPQGILMVRLVGTCAAGCTVGVEEEIEENGLTLFNAPNPATGMTTISYDLNTQALVNLTLRDVTGKLIDTFNLGGKPAGRNTFELNVSNYAPGIYSYTLEVDGMTVTNRMIVE